MKSTNRVIVTMLVVSVLAAVFLAARAGSEASGSRQTRQGGDPIEGAGGGRPPAGLQTAPRSQEPVPGRTTGSWWCLARPCRPKTKRPRCSFSSTGISAKSRGPVSRKSFFADPGEGLDRSHGPDHFPRRVIGGGKRP